ncbi:MAG: polysaccharide deacetylase family protein [Nanoarchaeota archaeon]|nr:polysaccharide deacetylase family protein [Nanoarchaeota archaeon]
MKIALTFDVEKDLHSNQYQSLEKGIPLILSILNKKNIKATFFVPAKLLDKFPDYFLDLEKQGHEIALHGYSHERFDNLSIKEKENRIKQSVEIHNQIFKHSPVGFRAPQHSIDEETLIVLKQNHFLYDASYTPLNLLQLLFFPKKFKLWLKGFFSPKRVYKLKQGIYEIPTSSFFVPFVSLPLRVFPWFLLKLFLNLLILTNQNLVFYAHSWDFIKIPESRIDTRFSHKKLVTNLEKVIFYLSKEYKFSRMQDLL